MSGLAENVIRLYPDGSSGDLPVSVERLGVAVRELDRLGRCIERTVGDTRWSAADWRVVLSPLMLRFPAMRELLAELAEIKASRCPDTDWAVRVRAARDEVERRLLDVSMLISSLSHQQTSSIDTVVNFSFDCTKLAEAVNQLRKLIVRKYPEVVHDG